MQAGGRQRKSGGRSRSEAYVDYGQIPKENKLLEKLYNTLDLCLPEEKDEFWAALRRELPNSFRFTGSKRSVCLFWREYR